MRKPHLFVFKNDLGIHFDPTSYTIPDQSLSVSEILARFTRGQGISGYHPSVDDPQNLNDEELMSQEILSPFEERQLALEYEENALYPRGEEHDLSEANRSGDSPTGDKEASSPLSGKRDSNNQSEKEAVNQQVIN